MLLAGIQAGGTGLSIKTFGWPCRFQLLLHVRTDGELVLASHIANRFEKDKPLDNLVDVFHLADGLIPHGFIEPLVTPVLAHLGVNENTD